MLALDTDAIPVEPYPASDCLQAAGDLGFRRFSIGVAREALRDASILPVLKRMKMRALALRTSSIPSVTDEALPASALLQAAEADIRLQARRALAACCDLAIRVGAPTVVLDLGPLTLLHETSGVEAASIRATSLDHALDRVLPSIHGTMRAFPDVTLAVEIPGVSKAWPLPDELEVLLSELKSTKFGWWFNTARAHRLDIEADIPPGIWFDRQSGRLKGAHLCEAGGGEEGLPLGSGDVDFKGARECLPTEVLQVVQMNPSFGMEALRASRAFLEGRGFA